MTQGTAKKALEILLAKKKRFSDLKSDREKEFGNISFAEKYGNLW